MRSSILLNRRLIINSSNLENLIDYYKSGKLAHAYLISTNNTKKCLVVLLNVIKNIFCSDEYSNNCNKCSLCHLIDINNLPSLKIIEPEGNYIKKDQILELKSLFSKESQYTKENIYIIKNPEKMNKESANTMLKFLEDPEGNVIGFFVTNNPDNVISTIISRCQIINVTYDNSLYENYEIDEEKYHELSILIGDYLKCIECEKKESILYNKKFLGNLEKEDLKLFFKLILDTYKQELNAKLIKCDNSTYHHYLQNLSSKNLIAKVNLVIELLNEINYNVNVELLLDRFIIEIGGINDEII